MQPTTTPAPTDYTAYGEEWEEFAAKQPKARLVKLLREALLARNEAQGELRGVALFCATLSPTAITPEWREKMRDYYRQKGGTALD